MNSFLPPTAPGTLVEERTGKVVHLHFECEAALPIGSFLRVTGSTLWAPGTSALDPVEAAPVLGSTEAAAFPVSEDAEGVIPSFSDLYTSSVEMVTTPETYPIWKTRKPVVVVIHHQRKAVQHHYYRYLVVSPGATMTAASTCFRDEDEAAIVSTSNEITGSVAVTEWEDPFSGGLGDRNRRGESSAVSLTSSLVGGQVSKSDFRNLPYRTLDIDVKTGKVVVEDEAKPSRLDRWNQPDDDTFRPFRIREAVRNKTAAVCTG